MCKNEKSVCRHKDVDWLNGGINDGWVDLRDIYFKVLDYGGNLWCLEHVCDGTQPKTNNTLPLFSLSSFFRGKESRKDNTLIVCD